MNRDHNSVDDKVVISKKFVSCLSYPGCGWFVGVIMDWDMLPKTVLGFPSDI